GGPSGEVSKRGWWYRPRPARRASGTAPRRPSGGLPPRSLRRPCPRSHVHRETAPHAGIVWRPALHDPPGSRRPLPEGSYPVFPSSRRGPGPVTARVRRSPAVDSSNSSNSSNWSNSSPDEPAYTAQPCPERLGHVVPGARERHQLPARKPAVHHRLPLGDGLRELRKE